MAEPFIKLYRKMLKWEWYDDINTCRLFLHCLLRAEWKAGSWHGIHYEAGQFITSIQNLANETNLSRQQVRTSLKKLLATNELTTNQHGAARIITVVKWGEYQGANMVSNQEITTNQPTDNQQLTPCKEYKEIKNKRNIYSAPKTAAEQMGGNTRKYSHEFFEELERQATLNPWGAMGEDDDDEDY